MAQAPITTIPPFGDPGKLPDCAKLCGPLYDANGACVPPAAPQADAAAYTACFCKDARVAPLSQGPGNVCPNACPGNEAGLQSIAGWFQGICGGQNNANNAGGPNNGPASPPGGDSDKASNSPVASNNSGGGDWISNHWQWVIMLVVLVVGIAGIWIGACVWRRRYLRNKDSQTSLGQKHSGSNSNPSWGPAINGSDSATPMTYATDAEASYVDKSQKTKDKRTWIVTRRT
ncbi:hypothetical protein CDD83_7969 [Cordyceps sp. RAO-2017]|nr:hypothetical protein CDD83_7969 [Cordyceps sp. RAO-2017]